MWAGGILIAWVLVQWIGGLQHSQPTQMTSNVTGSAPTPAPTPVQPPADQNAVFLGNIPSLNAQVTALRFFESGVNVLARESWIYADRFIQHGTRYINWELSLQNQPLDHRITFEIEAVWSTINGQIINKLKQDAYIDPGAISPYYYRGWGSENPGQAFAPGMYKVELFVEGNLIARAPFEVVETPSGVMETDGKYLGSIPNLRAQVTSIRVFESGSPMVAYGSRVYANAFSQNSTRYIYWELGLRQPAPDHRLPVDIIAVWTRANGVIVVRRLDSAYIDSGWSSEYHNDGWGSETPGYWTPGDYKVDLYIGGGLVGRVRFEIISNPTRDADTYREYVSPTPQRDTSRVEPEKPIVSEEQQIRQANEYVRQMQEKYGQKFTVHHKHIFGHCRGTLHLTKDALEFHSREHSLQIKKSDVERLDGDGIIDNKHKAWHFQIAGKTSDEAKQLFQSWYQDN